MNSADSVLFFTRVQEFLVNQCKETGKLKKFVLNCTRAVDTSSALINGQRFTKAPDQYVDVTETQIYLEGPNRITTEFTFYGTLFHEFERSFSEALQVGVNLDHSPLLKKRESYPQVQLTSPELLGLGANRLDSAVAITEKTDTKAAEITHKSLMSREVSCLICDSHRYYADSLGNKASEHSSSLTVSVSFALSDTSEFYSDIFGSIPTDSDLQRIVDEASKNLKQYDIRPLELNVDFAVLLQPRALSDLFSDLVFPNLEMRTIMDETGRWDIAKIGESVLPGVSIFDNPHINFSPFSSTFDAEGVPTKPVEIVKNGILNHPLVTSLLLEELSTVNPTLAARLDQTGHADSSTSASFTNLSITIDGTNHKSVDSLIACEKNVVVISWLTGMSVDAVTGQFALDAEGAKVFENGILKYSTSLTLRGNLFETLTQPCILGPAERLFNITVPSLLTKALKCVSKGSDK